MMLIVDTHCHALSWTMEHLKCRSEDDKEWVFGKTATSLFKFAG
jgi:hypothetical protein